MLKNLLTSLVLAVLFLSGALAITTITNCETDGTAGIGCLECDGDKIPSTDGKSCLDCEDDCDRCEINHGGGANDPETICVRCEEGYYKSADGDCKECMLFCEECSEADKCEICSSGTFLASDKSCDFCPSGCPTCSNGYSCDECPYEYALKFESFVGGPECSACGANCKVCKDSSVCGECDDYFYLDKDTYTCKECPHNCPDCKAADECDNCDDGYVWDSNNNQNLDHYFCIRKCLLLHDSSADSSLCDSCTVQDKDSRDRVRQWVSSEERCIFCPAYCDSCGNDGSCSSCQTGYYIADDGNCTACNTGCLTCTNGDHCTSCASDWYESADNECVDCNTGFNTPRCETCQLDGGGDLECLTCIDGFYSDVAVTCEQNCPSNCVSCTDANTCASCKDGYYDGSTECSDSCSVISSHCDTTCSKDGMTCDTCEAGWDGPTCTIECDAASECGECSGTSDYECDECLVSSNRYLVALTEAINAGSGFNDGDVCTACNYPSSDYVDANDAAFQKALDLQDSDNCEAYGEDCNNNREVAHADSCTTCSITDCVKCAFIASSGTEYCIECATSNFVATDGLSCVSVTHASCATAISDCAGCYTDVGVSFTNDKVTAVTVSAIKCTSCDSNFLVSNDFSTCYAATGQACSAASDGDCENTYGCYLNSVGPTCTDCDAACSDCDSVATTCTACPSGEYVDNGACSSCTATNCDECDAADSTVCLVCDSSYFLYHGTCRDCDDHFPNAGIEAPEPGSLNTFGACYSCDNGGMSRGFLGESCRLCSEQCSSCSFDETHGWEGTPTCDSCESGYYKSSDTGCTACTALGANCLTCLCTNCDDNDNTNDDKECLSCQDGFHGSTCAVACPDNCESCDIGDGECNDCADGYVIATDGTCAACPAHCDTCSYISNSGDPYTECDTCDDYYTQYDSTNVVSDNFNNIYCISCSLDSDLCSDGNCHASNRANYFNSDRLCDACADNCNGCDNAGADSCGECIDGYRLTDPTCTVCPSNCAACSADGSGVITCSSCNDGYYHSTNTQCESGSACPANCAGCTRDATGVTCTACVAGKYNGANDNECTQSCATGCSKCTAADTCSECQSGYCTQGTGAVTCISITSEDCNTCDETVGGATYCLSCLDAHHIDNSVCDACPSKCKKCSIDVNDDLTCSECEDGYYHGSNNQCESGSGCPSSCTACTRDANGVECSYCVWGKFQGVDKICEETCPSFCEDCKLSGGVAACDKCYDGYYDVTDCKSCSSAFSNCGECELKTVNGTESVVCHECYDGYVLSSDGSTCIACTDDASGGISNCEECSHNKTSNKVVCEECDDGYILKDDGSACLACDATSAEIAGVDSCSECFHHSKTCDKCGNGKYSSLQKDNCANLCYSCIGPDCETIVPDYATVFSPSDFTEGQLAEMVKKTRENLGLDEDDEEEDMYDVFEMNEEVLPSSGLIVLDEDLREEYNKISDLLTAGESSNSSSSPTIVPVLFCEFGCVAESYTDSAGDINYRYGCAEINCQTVDTTDCQMAGANQTCVRCCVGSANRKVCNSFTLSGSPRISMPITGLFFTVILALKSFIY